MKYGPKSGRRGPKPGKTMNNEQLRAEVRQDNEQLRAEVRQERQELRAEIRELRAEVRQVNEQRLRAEARQDKQELRAEIQELRAEMNSGFKKLAGAIDALRVEVQQNNQMIIAMGNHTHDTDERAAFIVLRMPGPPVRQ